MHLVFLVMVTSMILSNSTFGGESNDRIDTILSQIIHMSKRMDVLVSDVGGLKTDVGGLKTNVGDLNTKVGTISETEEQMEMKVVKMEDAMQKLVKNERETNKNNPTLFVKCTKMLCQSSFII